MNGLLTRAQTRWGNRLDNIYFWIGVAYFGLVTIVVWLFFLSATTSRTQARQAQADAIRIAEIRSAAESTYRRCIESRAPTMRVSTHVLGVNQAFVVLLENSREALAATPKTDPLYAVRVRSLARLRNAIGKVAAVKTFPVPSKAECAQRRRDILRGAPS